jgi:hypothetical protein
LVFMGTTGWAYCLDAVTGAKIWEKPTGKHCLAWEGFMRAVREGREKPGRMAYPDLKFAQEALTQPPPSHPKLGGSGGGGFNSTPRIFGDLAIFNVLGQEALALDLKTGEERWRRSVVYQGVMQSSASVLKWTHEGKEYLIAGGGCHDPATGKVLWGFSAAGGAYQGCTPAIAGDYWVGMCYEKNAREPKLTCWRFSPKGATRVWQWEKGTLGYDSPVIHRGCVYAGLTGFGNNGLSAEPMAAITDKTYAGPVLADRRAMLVCIDLATGKLKGAVNSAMEIGGGISQFAMEDRVFFAQRYILDVQPSPNGTWRILSEVAPEGGFPPNSGLVSLCLFGAFPTGAGGFLYLRPADRSCLIQCWDLRRE